MPVKIDPGTLKTGPGARVPPLWTNKVVLRGAGLAGPSEYVGQPGWVDPLGATKALPAWIRSQIAGGLFAHTQSSGGAHPASAISIDGHPSLPLFARNVESAIDELTGHIPPRPPVLGEWLDWTVFSSIPDWGTAKLADGSLVDRGLLVSDNNPSEIFPYYWKAPTPALPSQDPEWNSSALTPQDWSARIPGNDPDTDYVFNSGLDPVADLFGAGPGAAFAGGFTRDGSGSGDPVFRTLRVMRRPTTLAVGGLGVGLPVRQEVTVSGAVFPADRGVLALIHWPAGVDPDVPEVADFLSQDILDRCVAALLLGQGILGDHCQNPGECGPPSCDGDAGGIFALGKNAEGKYDPFAFPGQATGQYNLDEIHQGVAELDGVALKAPYDDFVGAGNGGRRDINATKPGAGQVRLGTDPSADTNGTYPIGSLEYGIPILGATAEAYDPAIATTYEGVAGLHTVLGNSIVEGAGSKTPGFFQYRLPYLKDYTPDGLKWTPSGNDALSTREKARYFSKPLHVAAMERDGTVIGSTLSTAGLYGAPFAEDFWPWQVARYRHSFFLPSVGAPALRNDIGTYWLLHFKKEGDFEAFVRDGVMPWDVNNGYQLYGASLLDTSSIEASGNLVNEETDATTPAPAGPAPGYGFGANSYHGLRSLVFHDPQNPATLPAFTARYDYSVGNVVAASENVVFISGVAYYIPRMITTGLDSFQIDSLSVVSNAPHGFWDASYRTDSDDLSTNDTVAPALLSTPNPMFLGLAAFGYGPHPSNGTDLSLDIPLGAPGVGLALTRNVQRHRVEFPYTYLGSNGAGLFSPTNGPAEVDALTMSLPAGTMDLRGDALFPSFSQDATLRAFFRRPLGHATVNNSALPYAAASGHGIEVVNDSGHRILLHTTSWDETNLTGLFGNFVVAGAGGPFPSPGRPSLFSAHKDTTERFLDETYRCVCLFDSTGDLLTTVGANAAEHLNGPGMGGWAGGPIYIPVRIGYASVSWDDLSWIQTGQHEGVLGGAVERDGLQVQGLPDMNPPISDGAIAPFPSTGVLVYPQVDYQNINIRPRGSLDGGSDFTGAQPSYNALPVTETVLSYIRVFDAAFSKDVNPESDVMGQPFVTFRFLGITLQDFTYAAPGPGRQESLGYSLQLKVPGLTTWMDMGRVDGGGPSKQDALLDGAGCKILGADTFDGVDSETGMVYCQVKCNVGPAATLFENLLGPGGAYQNSALTPIGEVPVMVKVTFRGSAAALFYDLEREHDGVGFVGAATPGTSLSRRRGLVTINVVRPS